MLLVINRLQRWTEMKRLATMALRGSERRHRKILDDGAEGMAVRPPQARPRASARRRRAASTCGSSSSRWRSPSSASSSCCRSPPFSCRLSRRACPPISTRSTDPDALVRDPAHAHRRGVVGDAQSVLRHGGGLGDHEIPVSRQDAADHADRPAVLGLAGRRRASCSCCFSACRACSGRGLPSMTSRSCSRCRHRARDHVRDVPVCCARVDPAHAGAGNGGGRGGDFARRLGSRPPSSG